MVEDIPVSDKTKQEVVDILLNNSRLQDYKKTFI